MINNILKILIFAFIPLGVKLFSFIKSESGVKTISKSLVRSDILDSDGNIVATNIPTFSVYLVPKDFIKDKEVISELSSILDLPGNAILNKTKNVNSKFAWLKRHISPWQVKEILSKGLPGVYISKDVRRFYPSGSLFSHVVGRVNVDGEGVSGVELDYNQRLKNNPKPLKISISSILQEAVKNSLDFGKKKFQASAVNAVLICAKTGKILSSYSKSDDEDLNPHINYDANSDININRNVHSVMELGSIFKVVNAAMLLENKVADLNSIIYADTSMRFSRHTIKDFGKRKAGNISFTDAFVYSANVANAKWAIEAGADKQMDFFKLCGFLDPVHIDGVKSAYPVFPKKWRDSNVITATYGYGLAITPVHFLQGMLRIVTGQKRSLHLLEDDFSIREDEKINILSQKTSKGVISLMELAVSIGYAKRAGVKGYAVAAKTGTANKLVKGTYKERNNRCSTVFLFPAHDPQVIGLVTLESPKPNKETFGFVTAGFIAAPIAGHLIKGIGPALGKVKENESYQG